MVGHPDALGLAVGPSRRLVRCDDAGHAQAIREGKDRYEGEERPGQHLPPDRKRQRSGREEEDRGLCWQRHVGERVARRGVPYVDSDAKRKEPVSLIRLRLSGPLHGR
jgi:hypothetical protein